MDTTEKFSYFWLKDKHLNDFLSFLLLSTQLYTYIRAAGSHYKCRNITQFVRGTSFVIPLEVRGLFWITRL